MAPIKFKINRKLLILFVLILAVIGLQFSSPEIENYPVTGEIKAPANVKAIFRRACYDCHSNETDLKWYDHLAPASFLVAHDVREARSRFNFSEWDKLTPPDQQGKLWEMVNMVLSGNMPLATYSAVHPEAQLSKADIDILKAYVNQLNPLEPGDPVRSEIADKEYNDQFLKQVSDKKLPVAANGVEYIPDYRKWQVISSTNRFDLNSIRVVYGNDLAVKTIRSGHVKTWPKGATIVKVVWDILEDTNGDIRPGKFNSVQIMTQDKERFPDSKGWGFAKFNGMELLPQGKTAAFNVQCFNCHKLASDNGYVFNVPGKV